MIWRTKARGAALRAPRGIFCKMKNKGAECGALFYSISQVEARAD